MAAPLPPLPSPQQPLSVGVVMPAYNAAGFLPRTLPPLLTDAGHRPVLIVDPGSTDGTAALAEAMGAQVLRLHQRAGPAEARNRGVQAMDCEVIVFIDADCEVHPGLLDRVTHAFAQNTALVSLTGSYDDSPLVQTIPSLYMNLRHHHTHQTARREPASFWAGCGAVRRSVFLGAGGFDANRYPLPMIEDIELGLRLRSRGQTRLDPDLQVKHLKHWTLGSVISTDIQKRAVPWTQLLREQRQIPDDLNLKIGARVAAGIAPFALASVLALPWVGIVRPGLLPWMLVFPALSVWQNRGLFHFFWQRQGALFAVAGWFLHQFHLVYSAVTFVLVTAFYRPTGERV